MLFTLTKEPYTPHILNNFLQHIVIVVRNQIFAAIIL